jgi:hypothetical protein
VKTKSKTEKNVLSSELLILPDGRIFVQSLTQPMAELLCGLNPGDQTIATRAKKLKKENELPNRA